MKLTKGMVFESNDPREKGRRVRLVSSFRRTRWVCENLSTGRTTKIKSSRLGGTLGSDYSLVEEA